MTATFPGLATAPVCGHEPERNDVLGPAVGASHDTAGRRELSAF